MEFPSFRGSATVFSLLLIALVATAYPLGPEAGRQSGLQRAPQRLSAEVLKEMSRKLQRMAPAKPLGKTASAAISPLGQALVSRKLGLGASPALHLASSKRGVPSDLRIHWNGKTGTPAFISGKGLRQPEASLRKGSASGAPGPWAMAYIEANRELFKLEEPAQELQMMMQSIDRLGKQHVKFRQLYRGIPVWGHEMNVHFEPGGTLYALNARYAPTPAFRNGTGYRLASDRALAIAIQDLSRKTEIQVLGEGANQLLDYQGPTAGKYIWMDPSTQAPHWVWHVAIRPNFRDHWYYFVDAGSGAILEKYNATNFDGPAVATATDLMGVSRTLNTYKSGSNYFLIDATRKTFNPKSTMPNGPLGALWTVDARSTDMKEVFQFASAGNTWSDASAVSAHYNLGRVFDYFQNTFNRQGIDGAGSTMLSVVHVTEKGKKMDNAYWNGKAMAYGDGNTSFKPLARALDVAAHEMTHGVIQSTVNLEYKFQSGALNESFADVFGAMVDRDDWKMGEDVVNATGFPSGALRDLENPHNGGTGPKDLGWQPAHMLEYVQLELDTDNGGVHVNSGIPNRACFLIANAIGREKTEKIYYRILEAHYLNPTSRFIDMRLAAVRAAADLHGESSPEVAAVKAGFDGVGIVDEAATPRPKDVPPVVGEEFIAAVNGEANDNSLYLAKPVIAGDGDIVQISKTQVYTGTGNPIAIPDDGSIVLFIDSQNSLRAIDDSGETVVSATGTWKSIAVSPDGARIAATTLIPDAKIYILDLINPEASKVISLYTPTTGIDIKADNVLYADALDWNSTGEFLLYDAFNRVTQNEGAAIEYWDANILDVKGEIITPFFASLPEGINIGNPSFAQTSDLNVVFDLFDVNTGVYSVLAADMFTGGLEVVDSTGTVPGVPRYSPKDDRLVYERVEDGAKNLRQAPLSADKIKPSGPSVPYMKDAQKPTWFAVGKRPIGVRFPWKKGVSGFALRLEPFDGGDARNLGYRLPVAASVDLSVYDMFGKRLAGLDRGLKQAGEHRVGWDGRNRKGGPVPQGVYFFRLEARPAGGKAVSITEKAAFAR